MEPLDYLTEVTRRWRVVLGVTIVAVLAALWTTPATPAPTSASTTSYSATTTLIRNPGDTSAQPQSLAHATLFAKVGKVPAAVAEQVRYDGDPAVLGSLIEVAPDEATGSLAITMSGPDGAWDARVADAFGAQLNAALLAAAREGRTEQITALSTLRDEAETDLQRATAASLGREDPAVAEAASRFAQYAGQVRDLQALNATAVAPFTVLQAASAIPSAADVAGISAPRGRVGRIVLGGLAGLLAGVALALLVARVDTRLRSRRDVEGAYDLPVLAEIPRASRGERRAWRVAMLESPDGDVAAGYRSLRSAIVLLDVARPSASDDPSAPKVVLVTSAGFGEGKTSTVVNLAAAFAETGRRVLVVDADVRHPLAHRFLKVDPGPGLTDLPTGQRSTPSRPTCIPRVSLLRAGSGEHAHVALSLVLPNLVADARADVDVIIIDSPPLLAGNEAMDAMQVADAVLLVSRSGSAREEQAERARELIGRSGVRALGVAFLAVPTGTLSGLVQRTGAERRPEWTRTAPTATAGDPVGDPAADTAATTSDTAGDTAGDPETAARRVRLLPPMPLTGAVADPPPKHRSAAGWTRTSR